MGRLDPSSYNVFIALIVAVVVAGSILVYRLRRDVEEESGSVSDEDLLKGFERAYYEGEMEEDEFRSVTAALRGRASGTPRPDPPPRPPDEPGTPPPKPDPIDPDL